MSKSLPLMCERCKAFAATEKVPERPKVFVHKCAWICEGFFVLFFFCIRLFAVETSLIPVILDPIKTIWCRCDFFCQLCWKEIRNAACCFFWLVGSHDHLSVLPCSDLLHCTGGNGVHYATEMSDLSHTLRGVYSRKGQLYREDVRGTRAVWKTQNNKFKPSCTLCGWNPTTHNQKGRSVFQRGVHTITRFYARPPARVHK